MRAVQPLLLLALALAVTVQGRELLQGNVSTAILNGRDDPELGLFDRGRFPYVVQIRYPWGDEGGPGKNTFICAGTLIEPDMVLTSAWCAINAGLLPLVRINSWLTDAPSSSYESRTVVGVSIHAGWPGQRTSRLGEDNLAMLRLNQRTTRTKPIGYLPPAFPSPAATIGTKMSIVGWGSTKSNAGPLASNLKGGSQLLLSQRRCEEKWSRTFPEVINRGGWANMKIICGAYAGHNKALCRADQGGPLVKRGTGPDGDTIVGVGVMTSCGGFGNLGGSVFANTAHYHGWIKVAQSLLRRGARSQGDHRIVYTKDVVPQDSCKAIGYPCSFNTDCCTNLCNAEYATCWY